MARIVVGYWLPPKKLRKFRIEEFTKFCESHEVVLVELNLDDDLSSQGPFDAIFHKFSDIFVGSSTDITLQKRWENIQNFITSHPEVVIIDPLKSMVQLCDRQCQYMLMAKICNSSGGEIHSPAFTVFESDDVNANLAKLGDQSITYPIVCKPLQAQGSQLAHKMTLVFCDSGLSDVCAPCVAQQFVPHNAVLHKLYVIGDRHFTVARPSLKNLTAGEQNSIFFDSQNISKDGCDNELTRNDAILVDATNLPASSDNCHRRTVSTTSVASPTEHQASNTSTNLDSDDKAVGLQQAPPPEEFMQKLVNETRRRTGLSNFGMDLIVENARQKRNLVIDFNCLPDAGANLSTTPPAFFTYLLEMIRSAIAQRRSRQSASLSPVTSPRLLSDAPSLNARSICALDSGLGSTTGSESDYASDSEKAHRLHCKERARSAAVYGTIGRDAAKKEVGVASGSGSSRPLLGLTDWTRIKQFYGIPKPMREQKAASTAVGAGEQGKTREADETVIAAARSAFDPKFRSETC